MGRVILRGASPAETLPIGRIEDSILLLVNLSLL